MNIDPTQYTARPAEPRSAQEDAIYDKLDALGIPFLRVDHLLRYVEAVGHTPTIVDLPAEASFTPDAV